MRIKKSLLLITPLLALNMGLWHQQNTTASLPVLPAATKTTIPQAKSSPNSASAFAKLWEEQVSPTVWGAADMAISVKITDGRTVWLYGDTLSINNGFVNSSAIVQDQGSLHVSHGGARCFQRVRT